MKTRIFYAVITIAVLTTCGSSGRPVMAERTITGIDGRIVKKDTIQVKGLRKLLLKPSGHK